MGKSGSKLKKKRSQSIAWSFRFPSLSSLSRRKMPLSPRPHLDVRQWLNVLDLGQYANIFEKFDGVEDLLGFSEADIKDLGVKNSAHRARVVSSLVALRLKHERGNRKVEKPQRHSVAVDTGRLVNQNGNSDILVVSDAIQSKSLCNLVMEATPDPSADPAQLKKALEWELSLDARDLRSHAWYHGAIPRTRAEEIVEQNDGDFLVRDCTSQPGNYVLTVRWKGQSLHFVINKVVIQPDTVYERVQYQFEDDAYDTVPDLITYYVGSGKSISSASGARIISPRNRLYPLSFYASKYGLQQQQRGAVSPLASPLQGSGPAGTLRYNPYNSYKSPVHSPPRSKRETPPRLPSKKQRSQSLTPAEQLNGRPPSSGQVLSPRGDEKSNSADGVIQTAMSRSAYNSHENSNGSKFSSHSLPRPCGGKQQLSQQAPGSTSTLPNNKMVRVTSDPALSPCMERRRFGLYVEQEGDTDTGDTPPPKPSRVPSMMRSSSKDSSTAPPLPEKTGGSSSGEGMGADANTSSSSAPGHHHQGTFQRVASYHASGSDSGNGSGDSAQSSAAGDTTDPIATPVIAPTHRGVVIKNPRYHSRQLSGGGGMATSCSSSTLKPLEYDSAAEDSLLMLSVPDPEPPSAFDLENFQTLLLPTLENKPLDATALQGVKIMLQDNGPRILANHLTKVDLELIIGSSTGENSDLGLGISSGIELITLPHGHQLRLDLVERTECLKLLVAVTILTCATEVDRAEALNKWIQVAIDTKTALGNLFGFCGVMMGLCMPQVQRLSSTWHVLRQKFTDSAFNFEAKLRPTLKSMNECTNPQAPNTTIPHLLPFILLQERTLDDILGTNASGSHSMTSSCVAPWESTADFGLGTLFAHMEAARKFGESLPMFRRNAEIVLGDAKIDELLMDAFRTEFHLKFLWGSRGACVATEERHAKFEQVLTVMSDKCEAPQPSTPASPPAAIGTSV